MYTDADTVKCCFSSEKLNAHIVNKLPNAPGFYSLDLVLNAFSNESSDEITEGTCGLIHRLVR